ncbi:MAG: nucleoside-diphosphate kinase [Muribaculaceae bacterium]|nr:nucleoside-diphosphate kinase [Muribaculaceae bacterium]
MEQTLVILKPSCVERELMGEVIGRIEKKGITIIAMKMMKLDIEILRQHYAHLVEKPFFPGLAASMMATPVVCMVLKGIDVVNVFREMVGATNGRKAAPGTLRGDLCMSNQANIVHASDSVENAKIEIARFFKPEEICDYTPAKLSYLYADDEL